MNHMQKRMQQRLDLEQRQARRYEEMRLLLHCEEDPEQDPSILQSPKRQKLVSWQSQFESEEALFKAAIKARDQILGLAVTTAQKKSINRPK